MRIMFQTEGGIAFFPGLSKPVVVTTDELSSADADELRELVRSTHFFALPTQLRQTASGAADYRVYTITVEEGDQQHTVQTTDPVPAELQPLIHWLQARARIQRTAARTKTHSEN